ncbi:MAG TPA: ATP-binding protein, partial [Burkholderiales bacterium]|nr:ATP-binding protein [Burkholderiales bacterium]
GAQRIYGYAPTEVLGRHFSWLCTPEDVKAGLPWRELATARAQGRAVEEGWRVRKSGERFWARVVITRLQDADGTEQGFAKMTHDLTERRQHREAEETARRMNEFVAMLAHELRNPLAPILNAVEAMERMPAQDTTQASLIGVIARQSRHLARMVSDLIDVNRIARGTLIIERHAVDLADAIRRSVEIARPAIDAAGQSLEIELPPEPLGTVGDLNRLMQLFANILNNASRYTPRAGRIIVAARKNADEFVISISDNGRGIAPEDRERIFNLFDQGGSTTHVSANGLGIGLSLARRIAELHGGTIRVESPGLGKGSSFHVHLPRALAPATHEPAAEPERHGPSLTRRRVLVVDDHVDAARMLELLLQCEGHETRIAHDGPSALKAIEEFKPEFVFLDIGMPGMSGYEIARTLRTSEQRRDIFLVALTGWGQPSDFRESKEAGFDLHLVKPLDTASVKRLLEAPPPGTSVH